MGRLRVLWPIARAENKCARAITEKNRDIAASRRFIKALRVYLGADK